MFKFEFAMMLWVRIPSWLEIRNSYLSPDLNREPEGIVIETSLLHKLLNNYDYSSTIPPFYLLICGLNIFGIIDEYCLRL